jgi:hypothetical protein
MFWRARRGGKRLRGTKALHLALLVGLVIGSACLPDPQQTQMRRLLDDLVEARAALSEQPPRIDAACDSVGEVASRLSGEPGLVGVRPAWRALNAAAEALKAVCGQQRLLEQPFEPTAAMLSARARWQVGVAHELEAACQHLNEAGRALAQPEPCPA